MIASGAPSSARPLTSEYRHVQPDFPQPPGAPEGGRREPVEIWEMINRLLEAAGAPPVRRRMPVPLALVAAWLLETVQRLARHPEEPRLTRFVVRELSTAHWFDISAARRDLGYAPKVSIAEGLRRLRSELDRP